MLDNKYVVVKFDGNLDYTVHLWTLGDKVPTDAFWKAPVGKNPWKKEEQIITDNSNVFLAANDHLYMGLDSGHIEKFDINTGKSLARYGPRVSFTHGETQPTKIRHLVCFDGKVYDASYGGLFETDSEKEVDDRQIGSAEVYDSKLLIVPHGVNPKKLEGRDYNTPRKFSCASGEATCWAPDLYRFQDSVIESQAGNLIDAISKEIVMTVVEPFDGSGMCPGKHIIANDKVYMHHGDYPEERITIRNFPKGDIVKVIDYLITTGDFIKHKGVVYDPRVLPSSSKNADDGRITRILRSDKDYPSLSRNLFDKPKGEDLVGIASAGIDGLLLALFNKKQNYSRIISHLKPDKPLLESEGILYLTKL